MTKLNSLTCSGWNDDTLNLKITNNSGLKVFIIIMADEKVFVFHNDTLPSQGFAHMEEIRRHGKLCDVTLKVAKNYCMVFICM